MMSDAKRSSSIPDQPLRTSWLLTKILPTEAVFEARGQIQFLDRDGLSPFQNSSMRMTRTDVAERRALRTVNLLSPCNVSEVTMSRQTVAN